MSGKNMNQEKIISRCWTSTVWNKITIDAKGLSKNFNPTFLSIYTLLQFVTDFPDFLVWFVFILFNLFLNLYFLKKILKIKKALTKFAYLLIPGLHLPHSIRSMYGKSEKAASNLKYFIKLALFVAVSW